MADKGFSTDPEAANPAIADRAITDRAIHRRVLVGTISNTVGQGIALVSLFFLTPFILHRLGETTYGLWVLVSSVVAYGGLLDLGVWGALIKYVAEYRARGEHEKAHQLIATALQIYTVVGLAVLLLAIALAPVFPNLFQLPPGQHRTARLLVILMGAGVGLTLPALAPMPILRGLQRYDIVNLVEITATIFTTIATIVVLLSGGGVVGLVLVNLAGMLVMSVMGAWFVNRIAPEIRYGWRGADRSLARQVFSYSWPLFIKETAGRLQNRTDEITIGVFLPVHLIPPYNLARRLSEMTYLLAKQFMKVLFPLASELHATNDLSRLRALYIAGTRLTIAISLAIGCTLILLARPVLTLWVGEAYSYTSQLVTILTLASFFSASQWPAGAVLQGMARHRILATTSLCSGIANLVLSVALIRPFGLVGVAMGTFIPGLVEFLILFPYTMRVTGVRPSTALKEIFLPAVSPAVLMVLTLYALRRMVQPETLLPVLLVAGAGLLVYLTAYLCIRTNSVERQTFQRAAFAGFRFAKTHLKRISQVVYKT